MENEIEVVKGELIKFEGNRNMLCKKAEDIQVKKPEEAIGADSLRSEIKSVIKAVKDKKIFYTKPFKDQVKVIEADFNKILGPLETAEGILSKKVLDFRIAEQRKVDEQERKARAVEEENRRKQDEFNRKAMESKRPDLLKEPELVKVPEVKQVTTFDTSVIKKLWTFEVVDFDKVSKELLLINEVKVNQLIREGVREIPGLRIFQREILANK